MPATVDKVDAKYQALSLQTRREILAYMRETGEPIAPSELARAVTHGPGSRKRLVELTAGYRRLKDLGMVKIEHVEEFGSWKKTTYSLTEAGERAAAADAAGSLLDGIADLIERHGRENPAKAVRGIAALTRSAGRDGAEEVG